MRQRLSNPKELSPWWGTGLLVLISLLLIFDLNKRWPALPGEPSPWSTIPWTNVPQILFWCSAGLLGLSLYFVPAFIAAKRGTEFASLIFLVNLLAGWTGIAWLLCILWAALAPKSGTKTTLATVEKSRT